MKRIISLILAFVIAICCYSTVYAESGELLTNGDFETGTDEGFELYGAANTVTVSGDYAHTGSYGAEVSERKGIYATRRQDMTQTVIGWGTGKYKAVGYAKLSSEGGDCTCMLVINYREKGESKDKYITSEKSKLTDSWKKFSINETLTYNAETGLDHLYIYFQVVGTDNSSAPSYCMDDLSFTKTSEKSGVEQTTEKSEATKDVLEHIDYSNVERSVQTTVGAIRWDAWYGHDGVEQSVISQVERSLSPAEFHYRAPFFSAVTDEGKIEIPEYTQEIFDKEMQYAIDAGLDYFAFLMYSSDMKKARNYFKTSALNDKIKMCCIVSPGQEEFRNEISNLFKQDYYMTVLDDRPLLYFYVDKEEQLDKIANDIKYYRKVCAKNNIKEPYVAVMTSKNDKITATYADAAAKYAVSGSNGEAFTSIMTKAKSMWYDGAAKAGQVVPNVSFGWQNLPRYKNPVSWTTSNEKSYAQEATDEELYQSVKAALDFCNDENNKTTTPANTITVYAWNEHDEGGWICPTIAVDENGNQLFNDDGTPKINTSHLEALKRAVTEYKNGGNGGGISADNTPAPVDADASNEGNKAFKIAASAAVVIVVAGSAAATACIILKKKAKKQQ